jgi:hypothetical protein
LKRKEKALESGKGKILKGICEQSSKTITALYLNTTQPQGEETKKMICQRLVFFGVERVERAECVECMERESDEERTGTAGVLDIREGGETGVDLVV